MALQVSAAVVQAPKASCLPDNITATTTKQQEAAKGQRIGGDDPLQGADVDIKVLLNRGESDGDGTQIGQIEEHSRAAGASVSQWQRSGRDREAHTTASM